MTIDMKKVLGVAVGGSVINIGLVAGMIYTSTIIQGEQIAALRFNQNNLTERIAAMEGYMPRLDERTIQMAKNIDSIKESINMFTPVVNRTERHFDRLKE